MDNKTYENMVKSVSPKSPIFKNVLFAFIFGGTICTLGQFILNIYLSMGLEKDSASALCSSTLILLSVILTGLGVYDDIAKIGGAGTLVPITGFANSVASPAIEFKSEGLVLGMAAKMFIIAGPVIVYGLSSSVICGIIYYLASIWR